MNYLQRDADRIRGELPADVEVPPQSESLFLVYAVLARVKGDLVSSRDVHDAWVAWMAMRGEQHKSMRPFEELTADVQREDEPFAAAIRRAASAGSSV